VNTQLVLMATKMLFRWTGEQLLDTRIVDRATVMAAPTKSGFNRVAWIMPYFVLVLGLAMVTLIVRAWRSRPLVPPAGVVAAVHGADLQHFRDQARKDTEI
jgi:cytochrome c-type biogenesis protein CcmH/NrfF